MSDEIKTWEGLGGGIYLKHPSKTFFHRPEINGKPTWRKLDVRTLKDARDLKAFLDSQQTLFKRGLAKDPYAEEALAPTVGELIAGYEAAGYPASNNSSRANGQVQYEKFRLQKLMPFWGNKRVDQIKSNKDCSDYAAFRRGQLRKGCSGGRSVHLELANLSSVFAWAVNTGKIETNPIAQRPPFLDRKKVTHCRDAMPESAAELHELARAMFSNNQRSEPLGWQLLLEAMTGCRTSEILRMRWDAKQGQAGFMDGTHLWLERSKGGINPWAEIHPALKQTLDAMAQWRAMRGLTSSPWFIPSCYGELMHKRSLTQWLHRLPGKKRTSHGMRAYYVTVRRSMGIGDGQIAAEIGDASGAPIIVSTYGAIPPNWRGQAGLGWMVEKPAWEVLELPANVLQIGASLAG